MARPGCRQPTAKARSGNGIWETPLAREVRQAPSVRQPCLPRRHKRFVAGLGLRRLDLSKYQRKLRAKPTQWLRDQRTALNADDHEIERGVSVRNSSTRFSSSKHGSKRVHKLGNAGRRPMQRHGTLKAQQILNLASVSRLRLHYVPLHHIILLPPAFQTLLALLQPLSRLFNRRTFKLLQPRDWVSLGTSVDNRTT